MKKFIDMIQMLGVLLVTMGIFIGIPMFFDIWWLLFFSWFPALVAGAYLDKERGGWK